MWTWNRLDENYRFAARIDEVPRGVIDRDVDVTNARRYRKRALSEYRQNPQVLRSVLDEDTTRG